MSYYKIRRKSDGKYSSGGSSPWFNRTGKTWNSLGNLVSHLSLICGDAIVRHKDGTPLSIDLSKISYHYYNDCEIIELEITHKYKREINDFLDRKYNHHLDSKDALD